MTVRLRLSALLTALVVVAVGCQHAEAPAPAISGDIDKAPTKQIPMFDFKVPTELPGVATEILDPRDTYADASQWEEKAKDLAARFIKNFKKYETNEAGKALVAAGPQL